MQSRSLLDNSCNFSCQLSFAKIQSRACGRVLTLLMFVWLFFQIRIIMFCLPISTFMYKWLYIPRDRSAYFAAAKQADQSSDYINRSQNWERGHAVSFLGIHKCDFQYSDRPCQENYVYQWSESSRCICICLLLKLACNSEIIMRGAGPDSQHQSTVALSYCRLLLPDQKRGI